MARKNILIMSNKGGVGKTTIAVNVAYALSEKYATGILDVDIHGPNVPWMLGISQRNLQATENELVPLKVKKNLYAVSIGLLQESNNIPVIWRGPLKTRIINQFVHEVRWPELDFLVVDLPPGTGDETITIMQILKENSLSIVVSTPHEVSMTDAGKAVKMSKEFGIPVLGMIENMSGDVFGYGGVERFAKKNGISFLGRIPLQKEVSRSSESGKPLVTADSETAKDFIRQVKNILRVIENEKKH